jgi:hypothetical protein
MTRFFEMSQTSPDRAFKWSPSSPTQAASKQADAGQALCHAGLPPDPPPKRPLGISPFLEVKLFEFILGFKIWHLKLGTDKDLPSVALGVSRLEEMVGWKFQGQGEGVYEGA